MINFRNLCVIFANSAKLLLSLLHDQCIHPFVVNALWLLVFMPFMYRNNMPRKFHLGRIPKRYERSRQAMKKQGRGRP